MQVLFENNMRMFGKRFPMLTEYEMGVNDVGAIQYMKANLYSDYGVGGNENLDHFFPPAFENCYDFATWNFTTYMVITDMPANTYARAPG